MATTCGGCSRLVAGASLAGASGSRPKLRSRQVEQREGVGFMAKPGPASPMGTSGTSKHGGCSRLVAGASLAELSG